MGCTIVLIWDMQLSWYGMCHCLGMGYAIVLVWDVPLSWYVMGHSLGMLWAIVLVWDDHCLGGGMGHCLGMGCAIVLVCYGPLSWYVMCHCLGVGLVCVLAEMFSPRPFPFLTNVRSLLLSDGQYSMLSYEGLVCHIWAFGSFVSIMWYLQHS